MVIFLAVLGVVLGLALGSFFNVLAYRVPAGLSLWWPPSACPQCGNRIRAWHNIPVLGWLVLQGRCYDCANPISARYPVVEALTGALGCVAVLWANPELGMSVNWPQTVGLFWLLTTLVPLAIIDVEHGLIPDTLSLGGIVVGLALSFVPGGLEPLQSFLGAVAAGGGLWLVGFIFGRILGRDAMGFGDVKLLAGFGALLGAQGALVSLILASFLGLAATPVLRGWKLQGPGSLPFGPFLQVGAIVYLVAGEAILAWYFRTFLY